ncbi:MAG: 2-C-methyl-D-erythritol 4-phosphate cytidylyltransferase [Pseudomonadota bacterium]
MKTAALIVAAGRGTRLGAEVPKQYIPLNGPCALRRSVELFLSLDAISSVVCVVHADDAARYAAAMEGLRSSAVMAPVIGGATRAMSVRAGLEALEPQGPDAVLIHDAARPFMPLEVILSVLGALEVSEGACAGLPVVDALWDASDGAARSSVPREGLWRGQTPQGFRFGPILAAHRAHVGDSADDVAVAVDAGLAVQFVPGSEAGYKITTPDDLARALRETAAG